jgi:hypothetical protein
MWIIVAIFLLAAPDGSNPQQAPFAIASFPTEAECQQAIPAQTEKLKAAAVQANAANGPTGPQITLQSVECLNRG